MSLTLEAFLGSVASVASVSKETSPSHLGIISPDFPKPTTYLLRLAKPTASQLSLLRHPIETHKSTGILTRFPSTTPFGLALGTDSPYADERCVGNLRLPASRTLTCFIVTHVSIRTSDTSSKPSGSPSSAYRTLSYHVCKHTSVASVDSLSPGISSAQDDSTSELLRFL
jgi:hypothetical protein